MTCDLFHSSMTSVCVCVAYVCACVIIIIIIFLFLLLCCSAQVAVQQTLSRCPSRKRSRSWSHSNVHTHTHIHTQSHMLTASDIGQPLLPPLPLSCALHLWLHTRSCYNNQTERNTTHILIDEISFHSLRFRFASDFYDNYLECWKHWQQLQLPKQQLQQQLPQQH